MMVEEIWDAFRAGHPDEPCIFTKCARDTYNKDISRESTKFAATHEDIDRYKTELKDFVVGIKLNIIFHIDESGCQSWVDAHPQFVLCLAETAPEQCAYKVKRSRKNYTVISYINLSGDSLPRLIIVNSLTLDTNIFDFGLRPGIDCYITTSKKDIQQRRYLSDGYKTAVLLINNLRQHDTPEVQQLLHDVNVKVLFLPMNSCYAFQPLDLSNLFVLKSIIHKTSSNFEEGTQATRIETICNVIEDATTTHVNITTLLHASFRVRGHSTSAFAEIDWLLFEERLHELFIFEW
ncbi:MAG: hypothetical protein EZS28_035716 [Streblomastix strix]|uniref:DDE-1 domain-containing protein n=1 Tax=Streblomastix strix TaxID=222440 RepID=A0A5J4UDW3_9EUKA|nr:MAG: hypothetical protein EZS28_035716 [Streblomastix strix]